MTAEQTTKENLEQRLKKSFPGAKKLDNFPEFYCIVVPMSKMDLISCKLKTLVETIKKYEEDKGYKLTDLNKSVNDYFSLTYERNSSKHTINIDGFFPGQVNIYYNGE